MKTIMIHSGPDVPIYRLANCLLIQAIADNASRITIQTEKPQLTFDDIEGTAPPEHIIKLIHIPFMKYARAIKWPWTKRIKMKRFSTVYEGITYKWAVSSDNIFDRIQIQRED